MLLILPSIPLSFDLLFPCPPNTKRFPSAKAVPANHLPLVVPVTPRSSQASGTQLHPIANSSSRNKERERLAISMRKVTALHLHYRFGATPLVVVNLFTRLVESEKYRKDKLENTHVRLRASSRRFFHFMAG